MTVRQWVLTACVVATLTLAGSVAGCSNVTTGTPMADPDQTGQTTAPSTSSASPSPTTRARVPDPTTPGPRPPGAPPAGLAATACGEYIAMDEATQRQVIVAIGEQNELVALNPELWITMASAMCTFADPATLVKDAVVGGGFN
ncbi:hypothetical protein [Mycolicibacterium baixiangningiae]|uniref:hypothetical protein n=1 Tax=Mycolicibacterium baixiangningiae TaxID=2761578 RepID=UPI001E4CBEA9|nr:hypothetical protein [Mycolicibacterium baixiangningiae]